jgi:hypothetical protein
MIWKGGAKGNAGEKERGQPGGGQGVVRLVRKTRVMVWL